MRLSTTLITILPLLSACMSNAGSGSGPGANGGSQTWDWQLSETVDLSGNVDVIDLDPDNVTQAQIDDLVARGILTIAYVSVGTLEDYRDDVGDFPAQVVGKVYDDWPDEKFLDIRDIATLSPLMQARFQKAKDLGFAAIEPDNMDVYQNDSGFTISAAETVTYVLHLADMAHGMGMQIGQKNVPELTPDLYQSMDFMIAEACFDDGWCNDTLLYIQAGKPVFDVEYTDTSVNWHAACNYAKSVGISMILHNRDLTGPAVDTCF